ncbi:hypothetical protein ACFL5O_06525 [Myxococcota bacterium]
MIQPANITRRNWKWRFVACLSRDASSYHSYPAQFTLDLVFAPYDFARIVRREYNDHCTERKRRERIEREQARAASEARQEAAIHRAPWVNPCRWLREALDALATQWLPKEQELLWGGLSIGQVWMQQALKKTLSLHGASAIRDLARGVMLDCARARHGRLGEPGVAAIRALLERELQAPPLTPPIADLRTSRMFPRTFLW